MPRNKSTKSARRFHKAGGVAAVPKKFKGKKKGKAHGKDQAKPVAAAAVADSDAEKAKGAAVASMGIDEFMGGGFELSSSDDEGVARAGSNGAAAASGNDDAAAADGSESGSESDGSESGGDSDDSSAPGAAAKQAGTADSSDSESDDDDVDAIARHQEELNKMQESQPEFFEFLRKNDPNLLNFANGGDSDSDSGGEGDAGVGEADDGSASEDEAGSDGDDAGAGQQAKQTVLTSKLLGRLMQRAFDEKKGSWRGVVKVLQAFRAACHLGDEAADAKQGRKGSGTPEFKYRILRGDVFNDTITGVLEHLNAALQKQVKRPAAKKGRPAPRNFQPAKCSGWKRAESAVRAFHAGFIYFIDQLSDPGMLAFALSSYRPYVVYLQPFPKLQKRALKVLAKMWSTTDTKAVRLQAFLRLRQMAVEIPFPFVGAVLKECYLGFVRNAKFVSESNMPSIMLMARCLVQLYALDPHSAYQHGFVYIRQLALHLRAAINAKTKDAVNNVYCWQYINCLRVWTMVLSRCATTSDSVLFPLVYPLCQLLLGTIRLVPTQRFFPLRMHCVRMLNELQWSCGVYVPVAPMLLEVVQHALFTKRPKAANTKQPLNLWVTLKLTAVLLGTKSVQDAVMKETLQLLGSFLRCHAHTIAFPEMATPVLVQLKQFSKKTKVGQWRAAAKSVVDTFAKQAVAVRTERAKLETGPANTAVVNGFMAQAAKASREAWMKQQAARQEKLEADVLPDASLAVEPAKKRMNKWQKAKAKRKAAREAAAAGSDSEGDASESGSDGSGSDSDADAGAATGAGAGAGAGSGARGKKRGKKGAPPQQAQRNKKRRRRAPKESVLRTAQGDTVTTLNLSDLED